MPDAQTWIDALQSSHDHCVRLVEPLTDAEVKQAAYAEEWSIAVTASPLGSQSEIMGLYLDAGLTGGRPASILSHWAALVVSRRLTRVVTLPETLVCHLKTANAGMK